MSKRTTASLAITKLTHAIKISKKSGKPYLAIPIEDNQLEYDEKTGAVYISLKINYKPEGDQHGQNGFISKAIPSKIYKELPDEIKKDNDALNKMTPILGSIKDWEDNGGNAANSGAVETVQEDEDDVPF